VDGIRCSRPISSDQNSESVAQDRIGARTDGCFANRPLEDGEQFSGGEGLVLTIFQRQHVPSERAGGVGWLEVDDLVRSFLRDKWQEPVSEQFRLTAEDAQAPAARQILLDQAKCDGRFSEARLLKAEQMLPPA